MLVTCFNLNRNLHSKPKLDPEINVMENSLLLCHESKRQDIQRLRGRRFSGQNLFDSVVRIRNFRHSSCLAECLDDHDDGDEMEIEDESHQPDDLYQ